MLMPHGTLLSKKTGHPFTIVINWAFSSQTLPFLLPCLVKNIICTLTCICPRGYNLYSCFDSFMIKIEWEWKFHGVDRLEWKRKKITESISAYWSNQTPFNYHNYFTFRSMSSYFITHLWWLAVTCLTFLIQARVPFSKMLQTVLQFGTSTLGYNV